MRKIALLVFFTVVLTNSYSGDVSWYKYLTGTIDLYPVTMSIVRYGDVVSGFYYYDNYKKPLDIFGTVKGDSVELNSYNSNKNTESFKGILKGNNYSGIWVKENENKELKFTLTVNKKMTDNFEFVYVKGEERFFKDLESPMASYIEGTFWPTKNYENFFFVRNSILKMKNMKTGLTEIGELMLANKKIFMKDFREQNADLKRDDVADGGWSYSLESQNTYIPVFFNENLFVVSSFYYAYTGGAHGNYGTGYTNLDLKRKKILSLEDVIIKKNINKFPKLLEKYYKMERGIPQEKSLQEAGLFLDTIPVNENFMISPGNLMFNYVPYEISSYADGEITINIPYSEISDFVKPEVKDLFK